MIYKTNRFFNHKTVWIEIALEAPVGGGELQDAVVGGGYAATLRESLFHSFLKYIVLSSLFHDSICCFRIDILQAVLL